MMQEIIKVVKSVVGSDSVETVNARDLHKVLNSGQRFADWVKARIAKYDFEENVDFCILNVNLGKTSGGRPSEEYYISIDMAKELAMVENNEEGKATRKWFIERDKKATTLEQSFKVPTTFHEALLLAAEQQFKIEQQKTALTLAAPKVEFYEYFVDRVKCLRLTSEA
jgi:anti-repressor protein